MNTQKRCLLLGIMLVVGLLLAAWNFPVYAATGLNVSEHSKEDIIDYIDNSDIAFFEEEVFITEPKKNTVRGKLSDVTKNHTLALLNAIRYIAGLDPVELDDSYGDLAQAAAFVDMSIFQLTHYPADLADKPAEMLEEDWEDGIIGARSCNLAAGYALTSAPLIWTYDDDPGNIDRIGHRRWCLNPGMGKTGFGAADPFTAMYCFDKSGSGTQTNVAWPAVNMPIEYFWSTLPWSLSIGTKIDKENVKVTLTRKRDGKVWTFDGSKEYSTSDVLYFNVDNNGYGTPGCIIFRPDDIDDYYDGDVFNVVITGVGDDVISYTVNFFEIDHNLFYTGKKSATTTSEGNIEYWYCEGCRKYFADSKAEKEITLEDTIIPKLPAKNESSDVKRTNDDTSGIASVGDTVKVTQGTIKVTSVKNKTVAFTKAKNKTSVTVPATVKINRESYKVTQINAKAFTGSKIKSVTIGKNVKVIKKNAFAKSKATKLIVKTKLLKKTKVKGCLKNSKIKTVQVKVSTKKSVNKKYVKSYKKIFTKANTGKKVTIK